MSEEKIVKECRTEEEIVSLLRTFMTENQCEIVMLRYGLVDGKTYTSEEVGQRLHITSERVREIEVEALGVLVQKGKMLVAMAKVYGALNTVPGLSESQKDALVAGLGLSTKRPVTRKSLRESGAKKLHDFLLKFRG